MNHKLKHRRGQSSIGVVGVTAVVFPLAMFLFYQGLSICQLVYTTIATAAGWPF